jgi:CRISPR-associated protein Cmr3
MSQNEYTPWRFHALDTWFFRQARPFDTIGSPELPSVFPPPAPTVAGAVKALLGQRAGIDWQQFKPKAESSEARHEQFGLLGDLRLCGPFLCHKKEGKEETLFPAPLFLLGKQEKATAVQADQSSQPDQARLSVRRLAIGEPVETDLGIVRLPCLPEPKDGKGADKGFKPLEEAWLTTEGLQAVLNGDEPNPEAVYSAEKLFAEEPRLGIGRDNQTGTVKAEAAMLYQTSHIRPLDEVGLLVGVAGVATELVQNPEPVRFGGEGRLALIEVATSLGLPKAPEAKVETHGLILILLTPAALDNTWRLPGSCEYLEPRPEGWPVKRWAVTLEGIELTIHSAVLGRPRREGGWHLAEGKPRRVESFVPAGSAWYCTVEKMEGLDSYDSLAKLKAAISKLHLTQIGDGTNLGRGLLAVGLWQNNENLTEAK